MQHLLCPQIILLFWACSLILIPYFHCSEFLRIYRHPSFNKVVSLEVIDENSSLVVDVNGKIYNYRLIDKEKELASGVVDKGKNTMTFVMKNDDVNINFEMKE